MKFHVIYLQTSQQRTKSGSRRRTDHRPRGRLDQSLSGSRVCAPPGGQEPAHLRSQPAALCPLVGEYPSHRRRSGRTISPNRRCWIICGSSPVYSHGLPGPPSTPASPSPIAPSATSFPMLPARSPADFIRPFCGVGRWAWPDRAGRSAGCASRNPNAASCRSRSMRWRASGPVFALPRDFAIVGLMLLQGLRSAEVLALNPDDVLLSEGQLRVRGKGSKLRFLPLAPETVQLLDHYLRLERPNPCSAALFVSLKGPARGQRMTPAGLRSLFRYHRQTTGIKLANPHRFRHTFASDMVRAGVSLPALMQLDGARRYPDHVALCAGHSTRRLPAVRARRGPAHPAVFR